MLTHLIDADPISIDTLVLWARSQDAFAFAPAALARLAADRLVVEAHVAAGAPVYGLNTGLGGNLGYRLGDDEVLTFQRQVIRGRMIGMGDALPAEVVRVALLSRAISLARGGSGVSVPAARALLALVDRGVTPVVPMLGSIGAGDLGLCAHLVAPLIGEGEAEFKGRRLPGAQALAAAGLQPAPLQAKDGLGLINASPVTAGMAAVVADALATVLLTAAAVAALSDEGYASNPAILDARIAAARPAGAQVGVAALFRALLVGSSLYDGAPRAIQDAISFRSVAQVFGAAWGQFAALSEAVHAEINGVSDSPIVFAAQGDMLSTPNFHTSVLALAFDAMAIALTQLASAAVQRIIKLQTPHLSGLPKYLSPVGGASVGYNALQKTAAALHAEIRLQATPASLDAIVVSDTVEDHATHALLAVRKLDTQLRLLQQLMAIEALVAAQAVDLRPGVRLGAGTACVHACVRSVVPMLQQDRPPGRDAMAVSDALRDAAWLQQLRVIAVAGMAEFSLKGLG
ncbi:MAG: aromatic amino acid lyase [Betaproteobacteria bacterium]